jgi:hypothetical protein
MLELTVGITTNIPLPKTPINPNLPENCDPNPTHTPVEARTHTPFVEIRILIPDGLAMKQLQESETLNRSDE